MADADTPSPPEATVPERVIFQRDSWDCGVASLAMVAGITYEAALAVIGPEHVEHARRNNGLPNVWMPNYLGQLGIATRTVFCRSGNWWEDGLSGLRIASVCGHFIVVLPDDRVLDPARGERHVADYERAFHVWEIHHVKGGDRA